MALKYQQQYIPTLFYTNYDTNEFSSQEDSFYEEDEQDQITKYLLATLLEDPVERQEYEEFIKKGSEMDIPENNNQADESQLKPSIRQRKSKKPCKFGDKCRYFKKGICMFSHEKPISCMYGNECRRKSICTFAH